MELEYYRQLVNKVIGNHDEITNKRTLRKFAKDCIGNPKIVTTSREIICAMIERCSDDIPSSAPSGLRVPLLDIKSLFVTIDLIPNKQEGTDVLLKMYAKNLSGITEICKYYVHACYIK